MIVYEINQNILPSRLRLPGAWIKKILNAIETELKISDKKNISIAFIADAEIKRLNKTYRGKNKSTDILSFGDIREKGEIGELILGWPRVREQAKKFKVPLKIEITWLIIHGMLHLNGYDHEKESDAKKMFNIEDKIKKSIYG